MASFRTKLIKKLVDIKLNFVWIDLNIQEDEDLLECIYFRDSIFYNYVGLHQRVFFFNFFIC